MHSGLSKNEQEFILAALKEGGIRTDGREIGQYRSLKLNFGKDYGSVDLSLGDTRYVLYSP